MSNLLEPNNRDSIKGTVTLALSFGEEISYFTEDHCILSNNEVSLFFTKGRHFRVIIKDNKGNTLFYYTTQPVQLVGNGIIILSLRYLNGDITIFINKIQLKHGIDCPFEFLVIKTNESLDINDQSPEHFISPISFEQTISQTDPEFYGKIKSRQNLIKNTTVDNKRQKSPEEELKELKNAIQLLNESNLNVKNGNEIYVSHIYGNLRQLVCRGSGYNPLLLRVAGRYDLPLPVFSFRELKLPTCSVFDFDKNLVYEYCPYFLSTKKTFSGQVLMDLETWLDFKSPFRESKYLINNQQRRNNREFIADMANTFGGAHYDNLMPIFIDKLNDIKFADVKPLVNFFIEISTVIVELGNYCIHTATCNNNH